jgi:hypothetical protein
MGSDRAYDLGAVQMGNAGQQVLGAEERGNKVRSSLIPSFIWRSFGRG